MNRVIPAVTAVLAFAALACGGSESQETTSGSAQSPSQTSGSESPVHAPANYVPGSYEDWCGGHQVPESVCTRCNSTLIAAFQATGDWCAEHGLPESQCLACNPDLVIERPPRTEEK